MDNEALPYAFGDLSTGSIWLTLTNQCNIHCKYCFNYIYKNFDAMTPELAVSISDSHLRDFRCKDNDIFRVIYFGGEPTINDSALIASIDYIKSQPMPSELHILTNGIIKPDVLKALLTRDVIYQISFDGVKNNVRFYKNGKTDANKETLACIKKVSEAGLPIHLRATIHQENVTNITELVTFCHEYNIKRISFAPICMFGDSVLNKMRQPDMDVYMDNMQRAVDIAAKYNINIELKGEAYYNKLQNSSMNIPFVWLPDGKVAMTITYASSKLPGADSIIIGQYSQQEQKIMLDESKIQQMNSNFLSSRKKYCEGCPLEMTCRGTLQFSAFATNTFIEERDRYFCRLAVKMHDAFPET